MIVSLPYGSSSVSVTVPDDSDVIGIAEPQPLADERAAFLEAVRRPIESVPQREQIAATDSVVIVTSDVTRATPNERLIPWILDEIAHVPAHNITVIIGTGSHRATTPQEMVEMFGAETLARVAVRDHDAHDASSVVQVGTTAAGVPAYLNRAYVQADKRIVVGFIEPHLYAGYSGGAKGVMPGVAGIATVTEFHNARMVGDPRTTWLALEESPVQAMAREVAALAPPDFLINVTLDRERHITGFFCGGYLAAHRIGCAFCARTGSVEIAEPYDVVVTCNGGYPLDQSLYQCGKGLTAAAAIVKPGGAILLCGECRDGFPDHGNFKSILAEHRSARELLDTIESPGYARYDQWAAHSQALVSLKARVFVYSSLAADDVIAGLLEPSADPSATVRELVARAGKGARCAVMPLGPYLVPRLARHNGELVSFAHASLPASERA